MLILHPGPKGKEQLYRLRAGLAFIPMHSPMVIIWMFLNKNVQWATGIFQACVEIILIY